jgi:uncharacterized membrane protein YphA (DoxX/SURF4 family)
MAYETRIGRWLFAAVMVALGVQCLMFSAYVVGLEPIPARWFSPMVGGWISGVALIGAGLSLTVDRTARAGALSLAGLFAVFALGLHGRMMIGHPVDDADDFFHTLAVSAGALALAVSLGAGRPWERWTARLVFGVCTIGHGVMHFVFFKFTADFIPAWIPFHDFWAAATGIAQIAAGLAILAGVLARLAAILTGAMYASWAILVHIGRIMAAPQSHVEWTSIVIASALCASALAVAGLFPWKAEVRPSA